MKILWITNIPVGKMYEAIFQKPAHGLWMDALLNEFVKANEHQLVVATVKDASAPDSVTDGKVQYYRLPKRSRGVYPYTSRACRDDWNKMIQKENPDLIQVWGTEQTFGLAALAAAPNVPAVVYMQGVIRAIARYYEAGMTRKELRGAVALRDLFFRERIAKQKRNWERQAVHEAEMLSLAQNAICENDWCAAYLKAIAPGIAIHRCALSINAQFAQRRWWLENVKPHLLMCSASDYPLKGLHMLIKALAIVKRTYPDVKLCVPGIPLREGSFINRMKNRGYYRFIRQLIIQNDLKGHIEFVGRLTSDEMADRMEQSHAFVMCSTIENHSSTLKEAMTVGMPCIASMVGGVPEYVAHGENGLLYRFEDTEVLATHICNVFSDAALAKRIGANAQKQTANAETGGTIYRRIIAVYEHILSR